MPLPWFRFYTEFAHDPKIQTLPIQWRFAFVMILCWHAEGELSKLPDRVKAKIFEISIEELEEMKATFTDLGFIEDGWTPKNWEKRQRPSDHSTPRVTAYRERQKHINGLKDASSETVTVTVSEAMKRNETVTETVSLLNSTLKENRDASIIEDRVRGETVTPPLRNGYVTVSDTNQPSYPDPQTTMHHVDTGPHDIDDATAQDIWRRIWATWKDESLCVGWYRWQRQYPPDVWVAAFSQTKEKYPNQKININLVAKIAANVEADGRKQAKPYAPDPGFNAKPKTAREERNEAIEKARAEFAAKNPEYVAEEKARTEKRMAEINAIMANIPDVE
jgi:hypothetical protein